MVFLVMVVRVGYERLLFCFGGLTLFVVLMGHFSRHQVGTSDLLLLLHYKKEKKKIGNKEQNKGTTLTRPRCRGPSCS